MNRVREVMPLLSLWCYEDSWLGIFTWYLLKFLGYIFWFSAAALAFGGACVILIYRKYSSLFQESFLSLSGWLAVAAAIISLPTGFLAISGSAKRSRYKQGALMYLLLVLLCFEMSSAVLAQFYSLQTARELKSTMGYLISQYNGAPTKDPGSRVMDMVQRRMQCCGVQNYTDWLKTTAPSWHLPAESPHVPESCCKKYSDCTGNLNHLDKIFQEGCLKKLEDWFHFLMLYMFWCCMVFSVLGLMTLVINGFLMRQPFPTLKFLDSYTFI